MPFETEPIPRSALAFGGGQPAILALAGKQRNIERDAYGSKIGPVTAPHAIPHIRRPARLILLPGDVDIMVVGADARVLNAYRGMEGKPLAQNFSRRRHGQRESPRPRAPPLSWCRQGSQRVFADQAQQVGPDHPDAPLDVNGLVVEKAQLQFGPQHILAGLATGREDAYGDFNQFRDRLAAVGNGAARAEPIIKFKPGRAGIQRDLAFLKRQLGALCPRLRLPPFARERQRFAARKSLFHAHLNPGHWFLRVAETVGREIQQAEIELGIGKLGVGHGAILKRQCAFFEARNRRVICPERDSDGFIKAQWLGSVALIGLGSMALIARKNHCHKKGDGQGAGPKSDG